MTTPTQAPTAQKRKRQTYTKNISIRPALALSTLLPTHYDILPGTEHLTCPDCSTWCPITGVQGAAPKLVPHHTEPAGTPGARRCIGSNRLVIIDITIAEQQQLWADAVAETASRRPTRVLRKVKAPQPPAIMQLNAAPPTAATARVTFEAHRRRCAACTGRTLCTDGNLLARRYVARLQDEPRRQRDADALRRELALSDQERAADLPKRRASEWNRVLPAVTATDTQRTESLQAARSPIFPLTMPVGTPTQLLKRIAA